MTSNKKFILDYTENNLQELIDQCSASGGGRVIIPAGRHIVTSVVLKSDVELHLEKDAILEGGTRPADYSRVELPYSEGAWTAVVMALDAENVAITGEGEIFGNGGAWPQPLNGSDEGSRPRGIFFSHCRNIKLEDFTLRDAACWGCVFKCCENITARRVKIDTHANCNNDGFDIEARNALFEDCDVDSGDDAFVIKSNDPEFVVENITIRNCIARSNCNDYKLGTASHGTMRKILVENCRSEAPRRSFFSLIDKGNDGHPLKGEEWFYYFRTVEIPGGPSALAAISGISVECVDGGRVEDVTFRNMELQGQAVPVFIRGGARLKRGGMPDANPGKEYVLRNVTLENIKAVGESFVPCSITGVMKCRPQNIVWRNVDITCKGCGTYTPAPVPEYPEKYPEANMFGMLPAYGLYIRHADKVSLDNVKFSLRPETWDSRPEIIWEDSTRN